MNSPTIPDDGSENAVTRGRLEDDEDSHSAKRQRTDEDNELVATEEEDGNDDDWDEEFYDAFVSAIFEIGLKSASPAVILENMTQRLDSITSERVKSKLQKYRNSKEKSRQEFMEEYRSFLQRAQAMESAGIIHHGIATSSPSSLLEMLGSSKLLGGDLAGFLTYVATRGKETSGGGESDGAVLSSQLLRQGAEEYVEKFAGSPIPFPVLSEEEKKTSLGIAMTFVMGLFLSMSQHLKRERETVEMPELKADTSANKESTTHCTKSLNKTSPNRPTPPPPRPPDGIAADEAASPAVAADATSSGQGQSRVYQPSLHISSKSSPSVC